MKSDYSVVVMIIATKLYTMLLALCKALFWGVYM